MKRALTLILLYALKRRAASIRWPWLRANKARQPFGLAGHSRVPILVIGAPEWFEETSACSASER
jgi:hypothetical protein